MTGVGRHLPYAVKSRCRPHRSVADGRYAAMEVLADLAPEAPAPEPISRHNHTSAVVPSTIRSSMNITHEGEQPKKKTRQLDVLHALNVRSLSEIHSFAAADKGNVAKFGGKLCPGEPGSAMPNRVGTGARFCTESIQV
jgi:hypothetical protein